MWVAISGVGVWVVGPHNIPYVDNVDSRFVHK